MATSSWRDGAREMTGPSRLFSRKRLAKSGRRWNGRLGILSYLSADLELVARHDLSREVWGGPGLRRDPCFGPGRSHARQFQDRGASCHCPGLDACGGRQRSGAMGASARINFLLLSAALGGCATAPKRRSGSMLVRGAGSSGKRRAIPRPRQSTTPTSISPWWREATTPSEKGRPAGPHSWPVHSILEPEGHPRPGRHRVAPGHRGPCR
jgi:hypothetical protein